MTTVYLSLAAVFAAAGALGVYARLRPKPAPAAPGISIGELFEHRRRLWDTRTPLAELEAAAIGEPWPPDEAAEMLAAWRDEARV